ncbi:hypothetical protein TNIN_460811 [Trichonephila inaurata madagascariensis]|uniref:Uncharacterized protein n=1 Tax=Trichonephila inaurata madagascariensis TaxID=2747483 RepID=A0A8X6YB60_9ARAC|nr:hypothetical protein TNIN_460811 [Trichonephila inaurata madagascariensis]
MKFFTASFLIVVIIAALQCVGALAMDRHGSGHKPYRQNHHDRPSMTTITETTIKITIMAIVVRHLLHICTTKCMPNLPQEFLLVISQKVMCFFFIGNRITSCTENNKDVF